jgi:hypothetical protein
MPFRQAGCFSSPRLRADGQVPPLQLGPPCSRLSASDIFFFARDVAQEPPSATSITAPTTYPVSRWWIVRVDPSASFSHLIGHGSVPLPEH